MQEKRAYARKSIEVDVTCVMDTGGTFAGQSKDISLGGMFILAEEVPSFGDSVTIELTLPGASATLKLPAVVRWADKRAGGFGVQFGLLGARETHAIATVIRTLG